MNKAVILLLGLGLSLSPLAYADHDSQDHEHEHAHEHEAHDEHEHDHDHADDEHREHGAHLHGQLEVNIARDGNSLEIAMESPLHNLLGFEYQPKTAQEKEAFAAMLGQLEAAQSFIFQAKASCKLEDSSIQIGGHDAAEFLEHGESGHNDLMADYHFSCENLDAAPELATRIFALYPETQAVTVNLLTEKGQNQVKLNADANKLALD